MVLFLKYTREYLFSSMEFSPFHIVTVELGDKIGCVYLNDWLRLVVFVDGFLFIFLDYFCCLHDMDFGFLLVFTGRNQIAPRKCGRAEEGEFEALEAVQADS